MKNKKSFNFIIGIVLILVGIYILFQNTYIYNLSFYNLYGVSTGAILIILLIIFIIAFIVKPNKITKNLIVIDIVMIILSLILGIRMSFRGMTLIDAFLIFGMISVGIGLVLKDYFVKKDKK